MSLFTRFSSWFSHKAVGTTEQQLLREIYGGAETDSGAVVTWKAALNVTTVMAVAGVIADGVATVPCKVMQKTSAGRVEASDHPLSPLLSVAPNDWQDSLEFRETLAFHVILCGNAFAFINRVGGRIAEMIPIEPGRVRVEQKSDYSLVYHVTGISGTEQAFPAESIWHIRGPSWNSWMGMEAVKQAREAIGLAVTIEKAQARLHRNGAKPSGLYSVDGTLSVEQYKQLRHWLEINFAGAENAARPMILDRNAKWTPVAMSAADAQMLESRKFQVEEICRAFRVMPIMVGYSDKTATYASAEQMFLAHAVHTVRPWHRRFEASMRKALLTPQDLASGVYIKFFDGELLRGAAKDRGEFYAKGIQAGWLLRNEAREWEDLDAVDGLWEPLSPANMVTGNPQEAPEQPEPPSVQDATATEDSADATS